VASGEWHGLGRGKGWVHIPDRGSESNFAKRADDKRLAPVQTPSQFTHPDTGHSMGKTEIGDTFEALFQQKAGDMLAKAFHSEPYMQIAKANGGTRNTPLDFRLDSKFAGEIKTLNVNARSQKTAIKAGEVARKESAAKKSGLKPLLVVQVVDQRTGTVNVFAHPAFASRQVKAMQKIGSYTFTNADFQKAQEASGHWQQRGIRAASQANKVVA
jgi:uncharacterized protein (DUF736 family)